MAEQRLLGALRTTLLLGPSMVDKFQDPNPKTPTNAVGYMIFVVFSLGIMLDFKVIIMGILLVKLELS